MVNMVGIATLGFVESNAGQAPVIREEPKSQIVLVGKAAHFGVQAAGNQPLVYQWQFNGTNILDATNANLVIPVTETTRPGNYQVTVVNALGTNQSRAVSLTWFSLTKCSDNGCLLKVIGVEMKLYRVESMTNLAATNAWLLMAGGRMPLNVNTATMAQLRQIPEIDETMASAIIGWRAGTDGIEGTEDDMPFRNLASIYFLAQSLGFPPSSVQKIAAQLTVVDPPAFRLNVNPPYPVSSPNPRDLNPPLDAVPDAQFYRVVLEEETSPQP
jgi:hypothetical protein